ncbi:MAG: thioesterase family protein [Oscillospiraceae bacterium]
MEIKIGLKGSMEATVTPTMTASHFGSGAQEVLATPVMIGMMEGASATSLEPFLEAGQSSVGTRVDIAHLSATPLNMKIRTESEVIEVERRRILFSVKAFDEVGLIGEGTHERFIIDAEKFMAKCNSKKAAK